MGRRHGSQHQRTVERRAEHAALAALGWSNSYIAWQLSVSLRTVQRDAAALTGQEGRPS